MASTLTDGFFITLPSNACHKIYKHNTSSSYRINLAQHLDLEGPWTVALCEISYPKTWYNLPIAQAFFEWRVRGKEDVFSKQKIRGGQYTDVSQLATELNTYLQKIGADVLVGFSEIHKRYSFQSGGKYQLRFSPPLAYILGVKPGVWMTFDDRLAPYPADLNAGIYNLYIYTDLITHQIVGDASAPLLRSVDVKGNFGDTMTQYFTLPYYIPVAKRHVESILIQIKTDRDIPVHFSYGKTIVKFHFKPAKRSFYLK